VLNWYYPTQTGNGFVFDGKGDDLAALGSMTGYLYKQGVATDLFDRDFAPPNLITKGLVSYLKFGYPLITNSSDGDAGDGGGYDGSRAYGQADYTADLARVRHNITEHHVPNLTYKQHHKTNNITKH
jgi:hypothetical protein